ncbi:MAG: glutamate racemase, partial [Bacteroidales bacterium]|nr:glutamate racemase [Bacteroidales bacterium]
MGGLSAFRELKKQLPQEKVIYFGDTAHAPYGEKSDEEILAYVISIVDFLLEQEVKLIVMVCNTATAVSLDKVKESYA